MGGFRWRSRGRCEWRRALGIAVASSVCLSFPVFANEPKDAPKAEIRRAEDWTFARYRESMVESGRKVDIDAATFNAVQARRPAMLANVKRYLAERLGGADDNVMRAFAEVPREYFHYNYQGNHSFAAAAYEPVARPYAVGYGSALSD